MSAQAAKRMRASMDIDAEACSNVNDCTWFVKSDTKENTQYTAHHCKEKCTGRGGTNRQCEVFERCGGCHHTHTCSCADACVAGRTCKHILLVLRVQGVWQPQITSSCEAVITPPDIPTQRVNPNTRMCDQMKVKLEV